MSKRFLKIKKYIIEHLQQFRYHIGGSPARDWVLILTTFLFFSVVISLHTVSSYRGLVSPDVSGEEDSASSTARILDTKLMNRVLVYYENRHTTLGHLLDQPPVIVDPAP